MSYLAQWMDAIPAIAADWSAVALESAVKGTALLGLAFVIARLARPLSAAGRHLVWAIAIATVLVLPILSATLPDVAVEVPRAAALAPARASARIAADAAPAATSGVAAPRAVTTSTPHHLQTTGERAGPTPPLDGHAPARAPAPPREAMSWSARLFLFWLAGALTVALWTIAGIIALARTVRRAEPVSDAHSTALARSLANELGLRRPPRLLQSHDVAVAMTCGVIDSAVVLPADARGWSSERMRVVLLHEFAHVKRRDCLVQLIAHITCALYWFHPMIWLAATRLRVERERACDDAVLRGGTSAPDYASQLLEMARSFRSLPPAALAMARPSQLEGRLLAILAPTLDRRAISSTIARRALVTASCIALPLAALSPRAVAATSPASPAAVPATDAETTLSGAGKRGEDSAPAADARLEELTALTAATEPRASEPTMPITEGESAEDIIFHPRPGDPLQSRLDWARAEAARRSLRRGYWIGYAISVARDDRQDMVTSGSEGWEIKELNRPSLLRLLSRARSEARDAPPALDIPEETAVAILFRYASPSSELARPAEMKARTLTLGIELDDLPVIWLGSASDEQSLPYLTGLYSGPGTVRIKSAIISSISVHRASGTVVPFLRSILEGDAVSDLREEAAEGLAYHDTREALDLLVRTSSGDQPTRVREEAVEALGEMRLPESLEALIDLMKTLEGESVVREAVEALGEKNSDRAAAALADIATSDTRTDVQREAVETLGEVPEQRGAAHLMRLARSHPSAEVRAEVAETLAELPPSQAILAELRRLAFEDPAVRVQEEAVEAIAELKDGAGDRLLDEIARDHPNPEVREEAREKKRGEG